MPLDEQAEVAATRPSPGPEGSLGEDNTYYNPVRVPPKAIGVRDIVRLFQCRICSFPLREPVSLPCGQSVCRQCLPETHRRMNITYPAVASRQLGFQCPFIQCGKEHSLGDCVVDVILNKAVLFMEAEINRGRKDASNSEEVVIHMVSQDAWAAAGVASLRDDKDRSQTVRGGKLVATFALAEEGELNYGDDVWYEDSSTLAGGNPRVFDDIEILKQAQEFIRPEMDCQVCYSIFYDPLTTACGHTFCRSCLHRILDHSRYCPICRRQLAINPLLNRTSCPSNGTISDIIETFWIDEILARKAAMLAEHSSQQAEYDVPLFVCTLAFPLMPTFLHIFEPRYRLMIRRVMEGNRTFGMVMPRRPRGPGDANFWELGTLLRVVNAQYYPDGRSLIETVGLTRFRVTRHGMLDGYTVGKIERIDDVSLEQEEALEATEVIPQPEPDPDSHNDNDDDDHEDVGFQGPFTPIGPRPALTREELQTMTTQSLMEYALSFVERMRTQSASWMAERMISIYGECPQDPAIFPWWFASMLPVKDVEKYRLLSTASVRDRLKICCAWIIEWEATRWMNTIDRRPGLSTTAESSEHDDSD